MLADVRFGSSADKLSQAQDPAMSAIVQKRTNVGAVGLSAKCQKRTFRNSFDHLVGGDEKLIWDLESERLGGLHVDDQLEFGRRLHGKLAGLGTL
jgi:hypothetical protein